MSSSVETFTICIGKDKKTIVLQPTKVLREVVGKFCDSRNLNPADFVIYDEDYNLVSDELTLGKIDGNLVHLKKKDELIEASIDHSDNSSSSPHPTSSPSETTTEQIKHLQQQLQQKEEEVNRFRAQFKTLTKKLDEYKSNSNSNSNISRGNQERRPSAGARRTYLGEEEASLQKKSPLKNQLSGSDRDRKSQIMECFTEAELTSLLENEMVSRIMVCRDLSLSPQGIHPDVISLTEFLRRGHYLINREDTTFLDTVSKVFVKVYKSSGQTTNRLMFWMGQLVYVHDWVISEQGSGNSISIYGVDLPLPKKHISLLPGQPETFSHALHQLVCKIFRKLLHAAYDLLRSHCIRLVLHQHDDDGGSEGSQQMTLAELLKVFTRYLAALGKCQVTPVLVLQFFHQLYAYVDSVMFNELLKLRHCDGRTGVQLKNLVARIDGWKSSNLKEYYVEGGGGESGGIGGGLGYAHLYVPFQYVAALSYTTEAANLLVVDKSALLDHRFLRSQMAHLTANHLHILLSKFVPDEYAPLKVPPEILEKYKLAFNNQEQWLLEEKRIVSILELNEYRL